MLVVKFWYNPNFLAILFLLFFSIPALKSLSIPGFYTSHDGETHTARIAQYYQAILDGQIPPRYAGSFYNGLASPIFVYIYPIPYLAGSIVYLLGFSYVNSFKILMALTFLASSLFTYLWLKEVFKSEKAAFLGALFYSWVPYRFSLIYVRASISELLAYAFLPAVLYSLTRLLKVKNFKWVAISTISIALLFLSQNLVALIAFPVIGGYILINSILAKSIKSFILASLAGIWGFTISAVTYLPSLFERDFIKFDQIIKDAYPNHFVTLWQLIHSPWGYGFDLPGTINDQMSFQIGLAHLAVFAIAIFLVGYFFLSKSNPIKKLGNYFFKEVSGRNLILAIFFIICFLVSVFLMVETQPTVFVWQNFRPLQTIDIPWRFLGICVLVASFLAAFVAKTIKQNLLFVLLILFVLVANRNHLRINQSLIRDDIFFRNYTGHATQYSEFAPKWRQTVRVPIDFDKETKVQILSGDASISNIWSNSKRVIFDIDVLSSQSQVRVNKFYFPGVQIFLDGHWLTPFKDVVITDAKSLHLEKEQDSSGLILLNLKAGKHHIDVKFGETTLRLFADWLSLASVLLALGVATLSGKNKNILNEASQK